MGPRAAYYASTGYPVTWHSVATVHHPGPDEHVAMDAWAPYLAGDSWGAWSGSTDRGSQWICQSQRETKQCVQSRACSSHFASEGVLGFCSDKSLFGGDCVGTVSDPVTQTGHLLCPGYPACTCCKTCLDITCSSRGPGWGCTNSTHAASLPPHSCVQDDSCRKARPLGKPCVCCKEEVTGQCEDTGCSKQWNGRGVCVDPTSDMFPALSHTLDFSVAAKGGLCGAQGKK